MDENYLGTLLSANDQLMEVLILYEQLDKSFDYDSDSEDYDDQDFTAPRTSPPPHQRLAGLSLKDEKAPSMPERHVFRPSFVPIPVEPTKGKGKEEGNEVEEEDDDDPFADKNAYNTPKIEQTSMTW